MSIFIIVGDSFKRIIELCISNILPSVTLIIMCYVLGLVTDRVADKIFEKRKKDIKKEFELKTGTSIAVWEEYSNSTYAHFTLSRIRILRSTALNSIVIGGIGAFLAYRYFNMNLALFILTLFIGIFWGANSAHKNLLKSYYRKTSALENETKIKNQKQEHQQIELTQ